MVCDQAKDSKDKKDKKDKKHLCAQCCPKQIIEKMEDLAQSPWKILLN